MNSRGELPSSTCRIAASSSTPQRSRACTATSTKPSTLVAGSGERSRSAQLRPPGLADRTARSSPCTSAAVASSGDASAISPGRAARPACRSFNWRATPGACCNCAWIRASRSRNCEISPSMPRSGSTKAGCRSSTWTSASTVTSAAAASHRVALPDIGMLRTGAGWRSGADRPQGRGEGEPVHPRLALVTDHAGQGGVLPPRCILQQADQRGGVAAAAGHLQLLALDGPAVQMGCVRKAPGQFAPYIDGGGPLPALVFEEGQPGDPRPRVLQLLRCL